MLGIGGNRAFFCNNKTVGILGIGENRAFFCDLTAVYIGRIAFIAFMMCAEPGLGSRL